MQQDDQKQGNSKEEVVTRKRTKLMVVGDKNVGKTTLLDCLFPLADVLQVPNLLGVNSEYYITLEGKYFTQYYQGKVHKQYILEKVWNVQEIKETGLGFILLNDNSQKKIEIYFKGQQTRKKWIERLKRMTLNSATHGIEVNTHIWKSSTLNQLQNKNMEAKQNENKNGNQNEEQKDEVEYSTWDFAGQNDYYNTHHYFLSNRSLFLVLYRMDKGIKGLQSLDFWLKSLSSHLNQNYCDQNGKPFYSIIIIGTFLDSIINDNRSDEDKNLRQTKIMEIYDKNGLKSPLSYFEVSGSTLENIGELREIIFNISLSHSYMRKKIPIGYLSIEKSIYELRKLKQDRPIIEIQDLMGYVRTLHHSSFDIEFVKGALRLFHEWGICICFDKSIELSNIVVLDPQHFTNIILGDLFKADEGTRGMRLNGIIDYSQLPNIWNGPTNLIDTYLPLLEKFEVCFILEDKQNGNGNQNQNQNRKKLVIPNLLSEDKIKTIKDKLKMKWTTTIPRGEIEIERIFSFNQVPSEMVSRLLVRFHDKIVDNIIWRRGVLLKHFNNEGENDENILCLLEVKMDENLFEIRIRGIDRIECLEMMKYIYEEVKIMSGNYGGVRWKECVRSPHFSKGLIDLDEILEDCKLELKDRKLICPITHFPIYAEDLLLKTGLIDTLGNQDNFENGYWKYSFESYHSYENQNQKSDKNETETIFENSEVLNEKELEKVEYLLRLFGFDISKIDKVVGSENQNLKRSFELRGQQIYNQHKDTPNLFKREHWIEQSESELRKSMIQYLGDYISIFRNVGWNHGNNPFVIPMIQGTTEDAALRICENGFGTACTVDAGYYAQGVSFTSKAEYGTVFCRGDIKVFVIGFVVVGNPFPVIEHPCSSQNYNGKPINVGYQSHFTLVEGRDIYSAFPITKVEQLKEKWIADELIVHESQTYPSYIVYYNSNHYGDPIRLKESTKRKEVEKNVEEKRKLRVEERKKIEDEKRKKDVEGKERKRIEEEKKKIEEEKKKLEAERKEIEDEKRQLEEEKIKVETEIEKIKMEERKKFEREERKKEEKEERKKVEEEEKSKLEEEKRKKEESKKPSYKIEFNNRIYKLKSTAKSFQEFESDIKLKLELQQNDRFVLEFNENGQCIVLDDMEDLEEGMTIKVSSTINYWWNTKPNEKVKWEETGYKDTRYIRYLLRDETEYLKKLEILMTFFGGDMKQVNKAYVLFNEKLFESFQTYRSSLFNQQRANSGKFKKDDWKNGNDTKDVFQKFKFYDHYIKMAELFDWNHSKLLHAIPMIHGTSETALYEICQTGLSATGATDAGFYGQGMYFSSSLFYTSNYAKDSPNGKPFIICMVTPGNVYPVTESPFLEGPARFENPKGLLGRPCKLGYQSHYTLVDKTKHIDAYPITGHIDENDVANELVVFQQAQVLPLFAIYYNNTV